MHKLKHKIQPSPFYHADREQRGDQPQLHMSQSKTIQTDIMFDQDTYERYCSTVSISLRDTSDRLASQDGGTVCNSTMEHLGPSALSNVPYFASVSLGHL